jgi:uncharacterized membrane protein YtjA (UPF0391 family)
VSDAAPAWPAFRLAGRFHAFWAVRSLRRDDAVTACPPADSDHVRAPIRHDNHPELAMLHYAIVFFVIAIIAAVLGFSGIAGAATNIAWILFVVFLILAVISMFRRGRV